MNRKTKILWGFFGFLVSLIIVRLATLQLTENEYKKAAQINSLIKEYITPKRGKIFDRNGKLLVSNQPVYSLFVIPSQVKEFDTLLLTDLLKIDKNFLEKKLRKARSYSPFKPSPVVEHLLLEQIAPLKEVIYQFPGFVIKKNYIRKYHTSHAANVLGYLQKVPPSGLKDPFYDRKDLIGVAGIEKYYEKILRGKKGVKYYNRDKFNRKTGSYLNGAMDTAAIPGKDLYLSIDIDLQAFIDTLMQGKHGAVVVLNPQNGEVLALVTAPSYDPSLLVGRKKNMILRSLLNDKINKPLFDRSILGTYPPGSPFKLINALIGLQTGAVHNGSFFVCQGGFKYGNRFMRCHCGAYGKVRLNYAIPHSCNTYFSQTYLKILSRNGNERLGLEEWAKYVKSFGLGNYLGIDLPTGRKGLVPDTTYYDRYFGNKRWRGSYFISNGIGQGQLLVTPLQMANMTAAIANRGSFFTPHLIKKIQNDSIPSKFRVERKTLIEPRFFNPVIQGMHEVFTKGTARFSRVPGIEICGKTGTAENFIILDGKKTQLPDHSIFVAFAPKEIPQIVVSIFIENGGFGSNLAAPIASLIIEKYLKGKITREDLLKRVMETDLTEIYKYKNGLSEKTQP